MRMFLTPETTFSVSLRWSDSLQTFLPVPPSVADHGYVFEIATPTESQIHQHYGTIAGLPSPGRGLSFLDAHDLIWGTPGVPGLVRKVTPARTGRTHPALTLSLARLVREELGLSEPLKEAAPDAPTDSVATAPAPSLPAEGNSASPSGSGLASSETAVAGSAATPS